MYLTRAEPTEDEEPPDFVRADEAMITNTRHTRDITNELQIKYV